MPSLLWSRPTKATVLLAVVLAVAALVYLIGLGGATDPVDQLNKQILAKVSGDSDIVAVVDGVPVTRKEVRIATEVARQQRPGLSEGEARKNGLHMAVKGAAIKAEVKRRGIQVTQDEAQQAADYQRQLYQRAPGDQKALVDEEIRLSGLSPDEFWKMKVQDYGQGVATAKLIGQVQGELQSTAPQQERFNHWEEFVETLVNRAKIEIKDPSIQ
ncbi:MAG: SurA N-terminal domain-containing protein [Chloroflexota bacterium]